MNNFFISQPMNGLQEWHILAQRQKVIDCINQAWDNAYILDSFITGAKDVNPLFCLGASLMSLSKADFAVFAEGWEESRGCRIEHACCREYKIPIYYCVFNELTDTYDLRM